MVVRYVSKYFFLICVLSLITACSTGEEASPKVELTVSAAASMADVLNEIGEHFEKENENINLTFNFGSSGSLRQQIVHGAPVDVFISAAENHFYPLVKQQIIKETDHKILATNQLVLIVPNENESMSNFDDLLNSEIKRIAIGTPEIVPAGFYARQLLEHRQLYNKLNDKFVFAKDVRQVLNYVETGNVDAGIVYLTDAIHSDAVRIVASAGASEHEPIRYPIGIMKDSEHRKEAKLLFDYITTDETAIKLLEEYGFMPVKN